MIQHRYLFCYSKRQYTETQCFMQSEKIIKQTIYYNILYNSFQYICG